jgi:hypothetical protein
MKALRNALMIVAGLLVACASLYLMVLELGMAVVESHAADAANVAGLVIILLVEFSAACAGVGLMIYAGRSSNTSR